MDREQESQKIESLDQANRALEILLRKIEESKSRNPSMSLRGFAQRVGVSSGSLSEILKGKRILTHALKQRMAPKLLLSPQETIEFFQDNLPQNLGIPSDERWLLSQDHFHMISNWWYYGLLNLIKTRGFKNQNSWMAQRLGLTINVVSEAWDRLFRLGFIEKKGDQIIRKYPNLKTTDNVLDLSVRKSHLSDLPLIEKSLLDVPLDLRDNISCTFVIDKKDITKAKELIRIFQSQFLNQMGKDAGEEVYKLTIALYPLTKVSPLIAGEVNAKKFSK